MKTENIKISLSIIFRLTLGFVFIYAAIDKINDPFTFAADIRNYQIIPELLSNSLAIIIPWLELFCGLSIIIGLNFRGAGVLIMSMMIVFIVAIISAMLRGLVIDCGCYHTMGESAKVGYKKLVEDIIYLGMSVYLLLSVNPGPLLEKYVFKPKRLNLEK